MTLMLNKYLELMDVPFATLCTVLDTVKSYHSPIDCLTWSSQPQHPPSFKVLENQTFNN